MKSAKCDNCGAGVGPDATACPYCGTSFQRAPGAAPAAPPGVNPEVLRYLRAGQKIDAIRVYREATKCGLREAKEAVDAIEASLGARR